jgi:hypothetical protein
LRIANEKSKKLNKNALHNVFIKVDSECGIFQVDRRVSINRKACSFIRSESIVQFKEYDVDRHHNSKHIKKHKNCLGAPRREKVAGSKNVA